MIGRTISLISISSIIFLVSAIHVNVYGSLSIEDNRLNNNQIQRYYTIASLINNQSSNKDIMIMLKSQLENSDPFKSNVNDNENNALNQSPSEESGPFDRRSNDLNSNTVNSNENSECEFDCPEYTPMRDNIPFALPSIPFP